MSEAERVKEKFEALKKELDDFIFLKFKLSKGQLITGVDLWNHLVENNVYEMMSGFLSISIPLELNEAIVVLDPLTNGFFGAKIDFFFAAGISENPHFFAEFGKTWYSFLMFFDFVQYFAKFGKKW